MKKQFPKVFLYLFGGLLYKNVAELVTLRHTDAHPAKNRHLSCFDGSTDGAAKISLLQLLDILTFPVNAWMHITVHSHCNAGMSQKFA